MTIHERRFLFRLALALGKTVVELLEDLSESELSEWRHTLRLGRLRLQGG